jgi:hypothetical protein
MSASNVQSVYRRATVCTAGVRFPARARHFSLLHRVYPLGTEALSPRVKQPGLETDHLPSSAVVKNGWAVPPLQHTSSGRGASIINHRDNFAFYRSVVTVNYVWPCSSIYMRWIQIPRDGKYLWCYTNCDYHSGRPRGLRHEPSSPA